MSDALMHLDGKHFIIIAQQVNININIIYINILYLYYY